MGELLFIGSCAGTFYAINKTTGQVQWSYDISKDGKQQSFHGDPLVINDLILIGTDRSCDPEGVGHVYAFERGSGNVRWKYGSTSVPTDIVQITSEALAVQAICCSRAYRKELSTHTRCRQTPRTIQLFDLAVSVGFLP